MRKLFPEHLADLRASGLTDETIEMMGVFSVPQKEIKEHLGFAMAGMESLLCFSYGPDFHRDKVFPPGLTNGTGEKIKYLQPKNSSTQLYVLPPVAQRVLDISAPLIFTEGEKKTGALVQVKKDAAIAGITGTWSWIQNGEPIPDLEKVPILGRWVALCFDSDTWTRFDLQTPVYALAKYLQSRGASPLSLIVVPPVLDGFQGGKVGIDDFLKVKPDGFESLTRVPFSRIEKVQTLKDWYKSWTAKRQKEREQRNQQAKGNNAEEKFGIKDFELWTDPVDGNVALQEVVKQVHRFLVVSDEQAIAIALWIFHAHAHDAASVSPLLTFKSPTPDCGKSTAEALIGRLTPRSVPTSNITSAALFRLIDKFHPTLLIDEGDSFVDLDEGMRGILNASHFRNSAFVIRTVESDDYDPKIFNTWCPKAVALIGNLPATLTSRSILIPMKRKRANQKVEQFSPIEPYPELCDLGRKLARWSKDNIEDLKKVRPEIPTELGGNRTADNWRPLLAIADMVGSEWRIKARKVAVALLGIETEKSLNIELLRDIKEQFDGPDSILADGKVFSKILLQALHNLADRPWPTLAHGKPMTLNTLGRFLREFEVRSGTIRIGDETAKGFYSADFEDAFSRYLSPTPNEPLQPQKSNDVGKLALTLRSSQGKNVTDDDPSQNDGVTDKKVDLTPGKDNETTVDTGETPHNGGWEKIE
jgi:putative DNA primase/helicase